MKNFKWEMYREGDLLYYGFSGTLADALNQCWGAPSDNDIKDSPLKLYLPIRDLSNPVGWKVIAIYDRKAGEDRLWMPQYCTVQ